MIILILIGWVVLLPVLVVTGLYIAGGIRQRRPGAADSAQADDRSSVDRELASLTAGGRPSAPGRRPVGAGY